MWSFVLAAMLVLPLAAAFGPHWRVALPLPLPRGAVAVSTPAGASLAPQRMHRNADADDAGIPAGVPGIAAAPAASAAVPALPLRPTTTGSLSLTTLLLSIYLTGLAAMALYRIFGWLLLGRLVARSTETPWPGVRQSGEVVAPVVAGILRAVVILPATWQGWDEATLRAVMAHERAHVERRDGLTLALAGVVKSLYWFHPLFWLLARRVNDTADLACDAAVLEQGGDVESYTRTLLAFAALVSQTGRRAAMPELAMATRHLGRRVARVFELERSRGSLRRIARSGAVLVFAGLPALCLAATLAVGKRPAAAAPESTAPKPSPTVVALPAPASAPVAASAPHFTAVSVKDLGDSYQTSSQAPTFINGVFSVREPLPFMVIYAYGVPRQYVQGPALEAAEYHRYDVIALAPAAASDLALRAMMRNLLTERFGLKLHTVNVAIRGYQLVMAGAPKAGLVPSKLSNGDCGFVLLNDETRPADTAHWRCQGVTMAQFAEYSGSVNLAPNYIGSQAEIENRTGMDKSFDLDLRWRGKRVALDPRASGYDARYDMTFFDALERQLGLRLEPADVTRPVLVVDAVNAVPTPDAPGTVSRMPVAAAAFASAAIEPGTPGGMPAISALSRNGSVHIANYPVDRLIRYAYEGLDASQLAGGPDWIKSDSYTVQAQLEPAGNAFANLRELLARRFQLTAHFETRPVEAWALRRVSAGTRPLLPPEGADDAEITLNADGTTWLSVTSMPMDEVADWGLRLFAKKYIGDGQMVNRTGLEGAYNFTITFKTDPAAPDGPGPYKVPLFQAIHDQLGLTLTKEMVPQKVLVIDHIDRTPSN